MDKHHILEEMEQPVRVILAVLAQQVQMQTLVVVVAPAGRVSLLGLG
jgi:hypothetical protein